MTNEEIRVRLMQNGLGRIADLFTWQHPEDWEETPDLIEFETAAGRNLGWGPTGDADYWETDNNRVIDAKDVRRWRRVLP